MVGEHARQYKELDHAGANKLVVVLWQVPHGLKAVQ